MADPDTSKGGEDGGEKGVGVEGLGASQPLLAVKRTSLVSLQVAMSLETLHCESESATFHAREASKEGMACSCDNFFTVVSHALKRLIVYIQWSPLVWLTFVPSI